MSSNTRRKLFINIVCTCAEHNKLQTIFNVFLVARFSEFLITMSEIDNYSVRSEPDDPDSDSMSQYSGPIAVS